MLLKKEEFFRQIGVCNAPEHFDQDILDRAAAMFEKWGLQAHETWAETDKEHLFQAHGLNDRSEDGEAVKREKKALRCIASQIMKTQISKESASGIMKNLNNINKPGFRWLE